MPSKNNSQKRFFGLVRGVQSGKISPSKVSDSVKKAAKSISVKDAHEFATKVVSEIQKDLKKRVLLSLKEIAEPMMLDEDEHISNPISKDFEQKGKMFDDYINTFKGLSFLPKEMESINNFNKAKPSKKERNCITYDISDDFSNNTTAVIKKLKDGSNSNQFSYTAFIKHSSPSSSPENSGNAPEKPEIGKNFDNTDEITVKVSTPFKDEIEGSKILSEFLKKIEL